MLKGSGPNLVTYLNRTLIFELVRCGSKNGHQNNICLKNIGLCAQNLLTILGSFEHHWRDFYDCIRKKECLHFGNE